MPTDSIICRRYLDELRGNPWICECPTCGEKRKDGKDSISDSEGSREVSEAESTNNSCQVAGKE
jgi:hypothetical protein